MTPGSVATWSDALCGPIVRVGSVGDVTPFGAAVNEGSAIVDASGGDYNLAFVS